MTQYKEQNAETNFDNLGDLVKLIEKYDDVKNNMITAPELYFELLSYDEKTQDIEQIMRYVMYLLTGKDYGVTDLASLAEAYDRSTTTKSASGTMFEQFLKYLHAWEGGSATSDGKYYIVESDGSASGSAVGHGVDIGTHGAELRALGYSTSIGSKIPVDVVDAIEKKEVNNKIKAVKSKVNGVDLTEYQIYALVSRAYNRGISGALDAKYNNGNTFVNSYKKYWNQEKDTKYGKKNEVDYSHKLYTKFLSIGTHDREGNYLRGLELRRKSEFLLFQTGYFDRGVNEYAAINSEIETKLTGENKEKMQKLINRAREIANDEDYQYYTYSQSNRFGKYSFDCSSFCYRLYKKYFNITIPSTTGQYGSEGYIGSPSSVKLQSGDILWRSGHVELYLGNNERAGAHSAKLSAKDQISIKKGISGFTKVYRFVK